MVDIIRAFTFPEKFATSLRVNRIVADGKIVKDGVSHYHERIQNGYQPRPIIVIKHPKEDLYAVLDGHHRFEALRMSGATEISSVVVDAYTDLQFELTKKGVFQPAPLLTKHVRIPFKKLAAYMKEFLENPWQMLGKE
ncbi:MAG: ParB/RepB/Spo0J family partition protein [Thermoplasmata archaeon]